MTICLGLGLLVGVPKHVEAQRPSLAHVAADGRAVSTGAWRNRHPQPALPRRKAKPATRATAETEAPTASAPIVAVIDGGVDVDHPALNGHLWTNTTEIPANGRDDDADGIVDDVHGADSLTKTGETPDQSGHGTHVAGIVVATDPGARIMALKAGNGEWIDVGAATAAVYYAVDHGARIINLSWAFLSNDAALAEAIRYASTHDVLVVAAAGNFGTDNDVRPVYPASYASENLVSVGASCDGQSMASFSDYGKLRVAIAAPGCDVRSTLPGGAYGVLSGTSMAAPAVAGAAALLLEKRPSATGRELQRALLGGARPSGALADSVASSAVLSLAGAQAALASPDRTAPSVPVGLSPATSFIAERDPSYYYARVTFSWTPSRDANLAGYRILVDGVPVDATNAETTSAVVKVPPGTHSWTVAAYDRSGNEATAS